MIPEHFDYHSGSIIHSITRALSYPDYFVQLVITHEAGLEEYALDYFVANGFSGVILFPVDCEFYSDTILRMHLSKFPLVLIDRSFPGIQSSSVSCDNEEGCRLAVEHLLGLGHRHIAFVADCTFKEQITSIRYNSYVRTMTASRLAAHPYESFCRHGSSAEDNGEFLSAVRSGKITAAVVSNSHAARRLYELLPAQRSVRARRLVHRLLRSPERLPAGRGRLLHLCGARLAGDRAHRRASAARGNRERRGRALQPDIAQAHVDRPSLHRRPEGDVHMKTPAVLTACADALEAYYQTKYPALAPLAAPCFLNTIETTVQRLPDVRSFVITGDIPAMWLRDSSAQVRNYLPFAREDAELRALLEGVIATQARDVLLDPYANAFNAEANGRGFRDRTERNDSVWERKYEVDSLCAPILLAAQYVAATGFATIFDETLHQMLARIAGVFRLEQRHERSPYTFERFDCPPSDTLPFGGRGAPVGYTGMTWSGFRPSDDACRYGYLIPANMMAVVAMRAAAAMARERYADEALAAECRSLADEIDAGIRRCGVVNDPTYGEIYAYEVNGLGRSLLMDDANAPSLLSAPYLGYCATDDPLYLRTRRFVLSAGNPFYREGRRASGVGSPHTPEGYIWHIGIIMQALTSTSRNEILACLGMLAATHDGTNRMHEAFDPDEPSVYTRPWFAWANTLLASLLLKLKEERFFD